MVVIDQLRISDDGQIMYIDVHVNTASYFTNVYLSSITIMTADKVSETTIPDENSEFIYRKDFTGSIKEAHLAVKIADITSAFNNINGQGQVINPNNPYGRVSFNHSDFSHDLFFVYIQCNEDAQLVGCPPCSLDERTTVGVTFDENLLYQRVMQFTKDFADDCQLPVGFTDFILLWNAFKASVETEHFISAKKFYDMLFDNPNSVGSYSKGCGCHG